MEYTLLKTNPDGTTEALLTSKLSSDCYLMKMERSHTRENLIVVERADGNPDWKHLADGWKTNALKHITLIEKVAELVKCNEPGRSTKWFYDLTQLLIDAGYIDEDETEYSHKDAIKNNVM